MLTQHIYCPLPPEWDNKIKECCPTKPSGDPGGSDCCYDVWKDQLEIVTQKSRQKEEKAKLLQLQLSSAVLFRDKYKTWYDELYRANELAVYLCDHFNVFVAQINNVCCATNKDMEALDLLFCMVRDFYLRVDKLKEEYDQFVNCIKCLNRPELNGGIIDCLAEYYKKLEAVIMTRDKIVELLIKAIKLANQVHAVICSRYGLYTIAVEWQRTFGCTPGLAEDPNKDNADCRLDDTCTLKPMLKFPLTGQGSYLEDLQTKYQNVEKKANDLSRELLEAIKEKELLVANKESLQKAILEVDPKTKCK